ncbi:GNAT family N-acetyltransferase [Chitinophaga pinensis]|uniref:GCN5-related N-acetyltransferase n=1 Tax=Chitinophaga pinensis (strain ATCC 43595 / DSM 2588 / LMG 13176 / NBRC 15968 / NCIMB 11800 / UQM 2034) TaxID=485918 RepID=A0A979G3P9_CHIPD|nr:GNAT family N-acetyltransferase [Chitinophaga pinensis]ACU60265.1 GCN5-related N-acetyltransferase [Chitinophaga pinensis DSM 2588]
MNTTYSAARLNDAEVLTMMSTELYGEIISRKNLAQNKIVSTLLFYEQHHDMGTVSIIACDGEPAGYAISFCYWSNEYGGLMLGIDELYIRRQYRRKGIAGNFIRSLIHAGGHDQPYAGIEVSMHVANDAAIKFLNTLGILQHAQSTYVRLFGKEY